MNREICAWVVTPTEGYSNFQGDIDDTLKTIQFDIRGVGEEMRIIDIKYAPLLSENGWITHCALIVYEVTREEATNEDG